MLFNSFIFLVFFAVVYLLYLSTQRSLRLQNLVLLVASYIFYGFWDWRYLSLLFLSTCIDFFAARAMAATDDERSRKLCLTISMSANLGMLGLFKYFNFFASSAVHVLRTLGLQPDALTLDVILPAGISFYTFQTMSYGIDVYRRKLVPTNNFLDFMLFVSFFPHLVAGPIMRATALLPQFSRPRVITAPQVNAGLFLILWGYFKKVVIADNLAPIANTVFDHYLDHAGIDTVIGILAFSFQIYGDFSGYTDIARGLAKLMGFELNLNFNLPYFALNPSDFWNRWHISLSSWLRDYLYIPLGGNRLGTSRTYLNLMLTMLLGGLWHGAAWTFVIWGLYHGILLCVFRVRGASTPSPGRWQFYASMALMFTLTCIGWVIFRARSFGQIAFMLSHVGLGHRSWFSVSSSYKLLLLVGPLVLIQICQYRTANLLAPTTFHPLVRVPFYAALLLAIIVLGVRESVEFIYFQF